MHTKNEIILRNTYYTLRIKIQLLSVNSITLKYEGNMSQNRLLLGFKSKMDSLYTSIYLIFISCKVSYVYILFSLIEDAWLV